MRNPSNCKAAKEKKIKLKKIFITGSAGFIGSHLTEYLFERFKSCKFILLDKVTYAANIKYLSKVLKSNRVIFYKKDINNLDLLKKILRDVDLAINVAAESHVDNSFGNSIQFTKTNTLGAHCFIEACRINNVKKIIHVSTDEVYGENMGKLFNEKRFLNPTNPYSASKAGADMIVNSYIHSYQIPAIVVRANNIFGSRQYPEKLISKSIFNFLKKKKMTIHGDGNYYRHFLHVEDFCKAIEILIMKGKREEIYNIASNKCYKITNVVKFIAQQIKTNYKTSIEFVKDRPFNDKVYRINCNKLKKLGWKPTKELFLSIPEIINWYKNNLKLF